MKRTLLSAVLMSGALAVAALSGSNAATQTPSTPTTLVGTWTNGNPDKGAATMKITSVDQASGEIRGTYAHPSGAEMGKEFGVVGFVSSAPPVAKQHNVTVVTFSTSLTTYGSVATWTGYVRDNTIVASWLNSRPNSGYEWDHITTGQDTWTKVR